WDPAHDAIDTVRWWQWDGVTGPHTYAIGTTAADVRGADVVATDDAAQFDARARTAPALFADAVHVPCDLVSHAVPAGASGTWLRVRPDAAARIWLSPVLAPQAVRSVIFVAQTIDADGSS